MSQSIKSKLQSELNKPELDYEAISKLYTNLLDANDQSVRFSVDAQHINRLGLELVSKQETALSELIKNAFDADASKVDIEFQNYGQPGGQLIVKDDGVGMDDDVIKSGWMRLSTNEKINNPISIIYGRVRAGRKGIGRFAVQRLGKKLTLETETKGATFGTRFFFDWESQFTPGKDIGTIWSQLEHYPKDKNSHGTKIIVEDLRDKWTDATIERVWKSVLLLQPPHKISRSRKVKSKDGKEYETDPGFLVVINGISSKQHEKAVSIKTSFLDHALAVISGSIDDEGVARFTIKSDKLGLNDEIALEQKYLATGKVSFETRYFIYLKEVMTGVKVKLASEIARKYGGIRVYKDGFRVMPYGEPQDDWLNFGFDTGRRYLIVPANNHNFFGQVELSSEENPLLEETSSREGLVENEAYEELRSFVRNSLEAAVMRIASERERKTTASQKNFKSTYRQAEKPPSEAIMEDLKKVVSNYAEEGKQRAVEKAVEEAASRIRNVVQITEEERAENIKYEAMLRILASLGISISIFSHEIKGPFSTVKKDLTELKKYLPEVSPVAIRKKIGDYSNQIQFAVNKIFDLGGYISNLISATESKELKYVSVRGVIEKFVDQFSDYMEKHKITFSVEVDPPGLRTCKIHRSELDSVLFNFLTNSIKALSKEKNRKIKISAFEKNNFVVIRFEDNGSGVPEKYKSKIFDAFFTTAIAANDDVAGTGTGLGLKIVQDIANSYGGEATLVGASRGYNTCFEFKIPTNKEAKK